MPRLYTAKETKALLNRLGGEGKNFSFALPYRVGSPCLVSTEEDGFFYRLPNGGHLPPAAPLPAQPTWQAEPPDKESYARAFAAVQAHLQRGDSYLLNLCMATPVRSNLSLSQIFLHAQAPYKMLLPGHFVCFSPEPFVRLQGRRISSYPMKGSCPAALPPATLIDSPKEQREHATVVDLLRNDLALVGRRVEVPRYRYLERIRSHRGDIWATSSEICAELPEDWPARLGDILFRLLPAGSICGAPKAWTCRCIAEAEAVPRGFYSGVFGHFNGSSLESAVSIRFLRRNAAGHYIYHSGGGITTGSRMEDEYRELCEKVYVPFAL